MKSVRYALQIRPGIEREMRESALEGEYRDEAAFQAAVDQATIEQVEEAEREVAEEREAFGYPDDTPRIQSADIWGTGEGQYHGLIA